MAAADSANSAQSVQFTLANILKIINSLLPNNSPDKTDVLLIIDSTSGEAQKVTLATMLEVANSLDALTIPATQDQLMIFDHSNSDVRKINPRNLLKTINILVSQTDIAGADTLAFYDDNNNVAKKITLTNFLKYSVTRLTTLNAAALNDLMVVGDQSDGFRAKKITVANFWKLVGSFSDIGAIDLDDDFLPIYDGSSTGSPKKVNLSSVSNTILDLLQVYATRTVDSSTKLVGSDSNTLGNYNASDIVKLHGRKPRQLLATITDTGNIGSNSRTLTPRWTVPNLSSYNWVEFVIIASGGNSSEDRFIFSFPAEEIEWLRDVAPINSARRQQICAGITFSTDVVKSFCIHQWDNMPAEQLGIRITGSTFDDTNDEIRVYGR